MTLFSKRIVASAVILLVWLVIILAQWSTDVSGFAAFVVTPLVMLGVMGLLAALSECEHLQ